MPDRPDDSDKNQSSANAESFLQKRLQKRSPTVFFSKEEYKIFKKSWNEQEQCFKNYHGCRRQCFYHPGQIGNRTLSSQKQLSITAHQREEAVSKKQKDIFDKSEKVLVSKTESTPFPCRIIHEKNP